MKLVLDSNIIFSALIKKSTTRNIILSDVFELHAPEYIFSEISKHKELLLKKSKMNEGDFDALLLLLQKHLQLVQKEKYNENMALAEDILKDIDITDSPFLALALALNCKIWSNDRHFKQQDKV
ncbi:MAG: PIN domain-containing protein, partial [Candidatus Methanoperedens sp.]|nr:PIN domain-containing protein [Candidatus Methanoperedens sp.]